MTRKPVVRRGFTTKRAALAAMREALLAAGKGTYTDPSKHAGGRVAGYVAGRAAAVAVHGRQLPQELRLHVTPYIGDLPLASLTSARLDALYATWRSPGRDGRARPARGWALAPSGISTRSSAPRCARRRAAAAAGNPAGKALPPTAGSGGARDAPVDRRPAGRVPALVAGAQRRCTPPGTCWPAPACAAVSCWPCAGAPSTWTTRHDRRPPVGRRRA